MSYRNEGFDEYLFRNPSMPLIDFSISGDFISLDSSLNTPENPTGGVTIQNPNEIGVTIPAKSITLDKLAINKISVNDYISSNDFASGSTGWRIHGNGDSEFNNVVVRGEIEATTGKIGDWIVTTDGIYYDGTGTPYIKTAATVEAGSTGVIFDKDGIRGYDSVLGNVFNLPTDGSAPTFSSGVIESTVFEINTNSILRTSETVGDGSSSSAGVLINDTGFYAVESSQSLANANVKILVNGSASFKGAITGTSGSFTGTIIAATGTIGGTSIGSTTLTGGTIIGSSIRGAVIETQDATPKIRIDQNGIFYQETTAVGKYGTNFKYGDGTLYGTGVIAYLLNTGYPPISILREQTKADIRLYNRSADPASGSHAIGDLICTNGKVKVCTTAGSPGTFKLMPTATPQTGYTTFTNLTTDRTCDANATSTDELADILGTLIEDLKATGIISA